MAGFPFVHTCIMCLMASVAAQRPFPSEAWSDSTGASFSEGNVITCTWGVLCRHGFSRSGPDEICESSFECTPAEVAVARPPLEPAQVPPVPPTEPGPVLPVPVSPAMGNTSNVSGHSVADAKPAKSPEASNASDASAPHEVPPAKPEMANGTMPHMPSNSSELNNASGLIKSSGASNVAPRPSLRGSGGKGGVAEKPEEKPQGPRRLHSRSYGHKIFCQCGVVCRWGFHMHGAKKICKGQLYCEECNDGFLGVV